MIDKCKPKNRIEFLEMIDRMYERKYENVNINIRYNGLEVEYDLNDSNINGKHQACFIPYPEYLLFHTSQQATGNSTELMNIEV